MKAINFTVLTLSSDLVPCNIPEHAHKGVGCSGSGILEVLGLDLDRVTAILSCFSSVQSCQRRDNISSKPRPLPSKSLSVHYSSPSYRLTEILIRSKVSYKIEAYVRRTLGSGRHPSPRRASLNTAHNCVIELCMPLGMVQCVGLQIYAGEEKRRVKLVCD